MTRSFVSFALICFLGVTYSTAGSRPVPTIEVLGVVDPDSLVPEETGDPQDVQLLIKVLRRRKEIDVASWLRNSFVSAPRRNGNPLGSAPPDQIASGMNDAILTEGFCFETRVGSSVCYKSERGGWPLAVERYTAHMTLRNTSGEQVWKTAVPFLSMPVYPFFVNGWIVYMGRKNDSDFLVIIDAQHGETALEFDISELGLQGFSMLNPLSTFPVTTDDLIVLQGCEVEWADSARTSIEQRPGKMAILKAQGLARID